MTRMADVAMKTLRLSIFLLYSCGAFAGVYKWVDEQGRIHYGDRPFQEDAQRFELAPAPHAGVTKDRIERDRRRQRLLEVYREERQQKQAEEQRRKRERLARREKCRQAKQFQRRLQGSTAVYVRDEGGERRYLEPQERERLTQKNRTDIDRFCGKE
jgi:hypothetical protein